MAISRALSGEMDDDSTREACHGRYIFFFGDCKFNSAYGVLCSARPYVILTKTLRIQVECVRVRAQHCPPVPMDRSMMMMMMMIVLELEMYM